MTLRQLPSERDARLARALIYIEAYGAERLRWPAEAAALFDEFTADETFSRARADAAALDKTLAAAIAPKAGDALKEKIFNAYATRPAGGGFLAGLYGRSGLGRLIPAGALAGLTALGFAAGAVTASVGASAVEAETLYYAQATFLVAVDEEDAFWAND